MRIVEPINIEVSCGKCGAEYPFEEWPVIPSVFLPDTADSLRAGKLFEAA